MAEYIEREALEKVLTVAAVNDKDKNRRTWAKAICVLHDMPAADVAPVVHGRWEYHTNFWRCSHCDAIAPMLKEMMQINTDYCPNCGAKMDGGAVNATD